MSPNLKTLAIAGLAATMSLLAAFYYPWPESIAQSDVVGKPLFEDYSTQKAKKLTITRYNSKTSRLESVEIQLSKNGWVLPNFKNFPVTNVNQNSITVSALANREVLLEESDQVERHQEYGVVDPTLFNTIADKSTLGIKVVAEGKSDDGLASLIVGKKLKESKVNEFGEQQYYVALPGKPEVYVLELDPRAFPTEFSRWVDPNLFAIPFLPIPLDVTITSVNYPPEKFESKDKEFVYQVKLKGNATRPNPQNPDPRLEVSTGKLGLTEIQIPNQAGQLAAAKIGTQGDLTGYWTNFNMGLRRTTFVGIKKKTDELTSKFINSEKKISSDESDALQTLGFLYTGVVNDTPQFDATKGKVVLEFESGLRMTMLLGTIALETSSDQNELNRHVMLTAEFVPSLVKKLPEEPKDGTDSEKKEYLKKVQERETLLKSARERVNMFNQRHAGWVYLIPETVCNRMVPDLDMSDVKLVVPDQPADVKKGDSKTADTSKDSEKEMSEKKPDSEPTQPPAKKAIDDPFG